MGTRTRKLATAFVIVIGFTAVTGAKGTTVKLSITGPGL